MHFTNDDMKNQIIGNDGNVYELDVRGGKPSEEKECEAPWCCHNPKCSLVKCGKPNSTALKTKKGRPSTYD